MRTPTTRRLESQVGVVMLIVIPLAAWAVALAVIFADRLGLPLADLPSQ